MSLGNWSRVELEIEIDAKLLMYGRQSDAQTGPLLHGRGLQSPEGLIGLALGGEGGRQGCAGQPWGGGEEEEEDAGRCASTMKLEAMSAFIHIYAVDLLRLAWLKLSGRP